MKADIHPTYYKDTKVVCACGNTFTTGSTKPEIHVEICSNCHPFYTGSAKFIDTEGRVERFQRQQEEAEVATTQEKKQKQEASQKEKQEKERPQTLREMMEFLKKQQ